ncbi:Signal recognition particle receptor FtsY [Rubripirellula amarantea]|uniref:Signal recognition particle receptor FtsY n=1 Tax=Rubripirellula amarantea TaxID=2527999 RepID=A0A5C5WR65_9BACT|nr:signal recognition particle-docking protein FtsY [Rubripirellula amarantea]TWT52601.1 Signal recognition particle receptor FtsY [Rubripirellula amarantea]
MAFWRSKKNNPETPAPPPVPENAPEKADPAVEQTNPSVSSFAQSSPQADADAATELKAEPTPVANPAPAASPVPAAASTPDADPAPEKASGGLFSKFRGALSKTRQALNTDIRDLFKAEGRLVDDEFLTDLFERLIRTDMGVGPAEEIRDRIGKDYRARVVHLEEILDTITSQTTAMLEQKSTELTRAASGPTVILVVGVNGSGKTTSIGKLAYYLHHAGNKVVLGAGDTFRAAAVEQLTVWAGRIGCDIVTGKHEADPASVAFQTVDRAVEMGADIAIIDTAGRLQTQSNLMQQLDKIRRVISKKIEDAPHEVLLVLDATAGQNAISQARGFSETAGCSGIVLAKLDGSAKGGVILPIQDQFQLPVKFVGLGEGIEDIAKFDPQSFAKALFQ